MSRWLDSPSLGDVVRLKSGGPKMTVIDVEYVPWHENSQKQRLLVAVWFDDKSESFRTDKLLEWAVEKCRPEIPEYANGEDLPLKTRLDEMNLSTRTKNALDGCGFFSVADIVQKTEAELLRVPNIGRRSLEEIRDRLSEIGLYLGMELQQAH